MFGVIPQASALRMEHVWRNRGGIEGRPDPRGLFASWRKIAQIGPSPPPSAHVRKTGCSEGGRPLLSNGIRSRAKRTRCRLLGQVTRTAFVRSNIVPTEISCVLGPQM
jgi:hypothetical protein